MMGEGGEQQEQRKERGWFGFYVDGTLGGTWDRGGMVWAGVFPLGIAEGGGPEMLLGGQSERWQPLLSDVWKMEINGGKGPGHGEIPAD